MAGPQRAAAVLLAMDKHDAQTLLRHFTPDELREVTVAAARLGSLPHSALDSLVERFQQDFADGSGLARRRGACARACRRRGDARSHHQLSAIGVRGRAGRSLEGASRTCRRSFSSASSPSEHPLDRHLHSVAARIAADRAARRRAAARLAQRGAVPADRAAADLAAGAGRARTQPARGAARRHDERLGRRGAHAHRRHHQRPGPGRRRRRDEGAREPRGRRTPRRCARCCSRSSICRGCRNAPARCCSTSCRPISSCWRCAAPTRSSARRRCRRWRRARAGWSRANSPRLDDAKPADIAKARREVVKIVLAMAQKGELELPSNEVHDGMAAA